MEPIVISEALSHVWYRVITKYLRMCDIYYLCLAFPGITDMFPVCESICYQYEIQNYWVCRCCSLRFKDWIQFRHHTVKCKENDKRTTEFAIKTRAGNYKIYVGSTSFNRYGCFSYGYGLISCSVCSAEIHGNHLLLRKHQYECHGVPKGFTCAACKKQYYQKSSLRRHQKKMHM